MTAWTKLYEWVCAIGCGVCDVESHAPLSKRVTVVRPGECSPEQACRETERIKASASPTPVRPSPHPTVDTDTAALLRVNNQP